MSLEKIVLGTAIDDPTTIEEISNLRVTDFSGTNKDLFDVILALHNEEALSLRSVVETLREQDMLDFVGDAEISGESYIRQLIGQADSRGIKHHVKKIKERSTRQNLREMAALMNAEAADTGRDLDLIMDEAEKRIFDLRRRTNTADGQTMADLVETYMPFLEGMRNGEIKPAWTPPIEALSDIVQYVSRTEFVVLAGRPGDGKSSMLRYQALKTATQDNPQKVITFNLENDPWEYLKFALCTVTGVNSRKLKEPGLLTDNEYEMIKEAAVFIEQLPWEIVTLPHPKAVELERVARKKVAEGAELIQVDYIQLISNGISRRVEDLSETTGVLRGIALKTNVPVVAACQLSRAIENRGELAEPRLSDLRESGSIEQDATQVWFIRSMWHDPPMGDELTNREFFFTENFEGHNNSRVKDVVEAKPIKIYIKKNRNGPIGATRPIKWNMANGRFTSFDTERIPF